ncbi:MAG: extracellular solute-binding protein [Lachnospiraceae bacterium]|nr:extracellular solute-binding protein [Lachnospiraceae bacterium]
MKAKKLLAMLLACMMLCLVACGDNATTTTEANKETNAPETNAPETNAPETNAPENNEPIKVTLFDNLGWTTLNEILIAAAAEYNALGRGYEVTFVSGSENDLWSALGSADKPDAWMITYGDIATRAKEGLIQPIDDMLPAEFFEDYTDTIKDMTSYAGNYYAIPIYTEVQCAMYYRKDLLEAAGLEVPKTWDELLTVAKALTTDEMAGVEMPVSTSGDFAWCTIGMQYGAGGQFPVNDDWTQAQVNEGYLEMANFFKELNDAGVLPAEPTAYDSLTNLENGKVAIKLSSGWLVDYIETDCPNNAENIGVALPPSKDGAEDAITTTLNGWCFVMREGSEAAEGIADFLYWLNVEETEKVLAMYTTANGSIVPAFQSQKDWISANIIPTKSYASVLIALADHAVGMPGYDGGIKQAIADMVTKVVNGELSGDDAIKYANETIQYILDK